MIMLYFIRIRDSQKLHYGNRYINQLVYVWSRSANYCCRSANYCCTRYGIIDDQKTAVIAIGRCCFVDVVSSYIFASCKNELSAIRLFLTKLSSMTIHVLRLLSFRNLECVFKTKVGAALGFFRSRIHRLAILWVWHLDGFHPFPWSPTVSTVGVFGDDLIIAVARAALRSHPLIPFTCFLFIRHQKTGDVSVVVFF